MKQLAPLVLLLAACPNTPIENPEAPGALVATHGACAKRCDLSTDEKLGAVYQELTGKSLGPKPECVSRSTALPRVVALGSFASDRGCILQGAFVDCCYSEIKEPSALLDLGWITRNPKQREELAVQFTQEVVLAFSRPLAAATEDFGVTLDGKTTPTFTPLTAASNDDGSVAVEYWSRLPGGMVRQLAPSYQKSRLTFGAEGGITNRETIDAFQGKPFEQKNTLPLDPRPK